MNALLETYVEPGVSLSQGSREDTCQVTLPVHMGPFTVWVQGEAAFTMQNGQGTVTVQSLWAGALPLSPDLVLPLLPLPDSGAGKGRTLTIDPPRLSVPGLGFGGVAGGNRLYTGRQRTDPVLSLPSVAGDLLRRWLGLVKPGILWAFSLYEAVKNRLTNGGKCAIVASVKKKALQ